MPVHPAYRHIILDRHTPADAHLRHTVEATYEQPEHHALDGSGIVFGLLLVAPFWLGVIAVWSWWPVVRAGAGVMWRVLRLVAI